MILRSRKKPIAMKSVALAVVLVLGLAVAPAVGAPSLEIQLESDANEVQSVTVNASGGQFRLSFRADETGDLAFNASAAQIEAALEALPSINAGGGSVVVGGGPGSAGGATPYLVTFNGGPLANTDLEEMGAANGTVPLSGGASKVSVSTSDQGGVSRSDERLDYKVEVKNAGSQAAVVGDVLTCVGADPEKLWFPQAASFGVINTFTFEWRRNGEVVPGQSSKTYATTAPDAGKAIQCLVTGTNEQPSAPGVKRSAVFASLPAFVVDPQPTPAPPQPSDPHVAESRPTITDAGGGERTGMEKAVCHPPVNWLGSPTYAFQWLRNAQSIPGAEAETAEYQPVAADDEKVLQCRVIGINAGGSIVGVSETSAVGTVTEPPFNSPTQTPEVVANATSGTLTLELELPGGVGTYAFTAKGTDWSCDKVPVFGAQHAKAICTSAKVVAPQKSYSPLSVVTVLGADASDVAAARATAFGGGAPTPASDEDVFSFGPPIPFGLTTFEAGVFDSEGKDYTQAGGHGFAGEANFVFSQKRQVSPENSEPSANFVPIEHIKQVVTDLPRGFVGNPLAVPELCPTTEDIAAGTCPPTSRVGGIVLFFSGTPLPGNKFPIYAMEPESGTPAQFAFTEGKRVYTLSTRLRPDDGYGISLELTPAPVLDLLESQVTICNFGTNLVGKTFVGCKQGSDPGANPKPLFTNPTRCGSPAPVVTVHIDTWEHPGAHGSDGLPDFNDPDWRQFSASNPEVTGCENVKFEPDMSLQPTTSQADSPTGLDVELTMPTEGLEKADGISQANLREARVTFPEGMAVNASAGHGLTSCSAAQVKLGTNLPISCPDSSKIGTVEIETPLIKETLRGATYIAKQGDVDGSLIGLYMVFESKKDGILIKMPARVTPNPQTGRLVVSVEESPEDPFSSVTMHFPGGPRATLITPPTCGTKEIKAELFPWTGGAPVIQTSSFEVTSGPNGGPCPTGDLKPKLSAGTTNPLAGHTSPFVMRLSRDDGTDRVTALNLSTPKGLTAYLRGIPYCPDAVLAGISGAPGTGQAQIDNPSCPAASQVGTAIAGAGAGADPLFVDTGRAYLAGPYKGAPLSLALVTPAVAGPLDLGNVVVRTALHVNPETAQITAVSDPIPTILHGILLDIRDIRVAIDRPNFTLNPTSCEPLSVGAEVKGEQGASASLSNRFQVGGCESLSFAPRLSVRLSGATRRGGHPSLRGVVEARPGEANIARAAVTIPRSEFLDQAHIRTICTRVQFAAKACPPGSVYGHATATTPLLDYPVEGPVYLRSSDHKLPDLVAALRGPAHQPIEAVVIGRVDSIKGQIRNTFEAAPDVPVTRFVLSMQGGKKGLLVNSRDVCVGKNRLTVKLEGHNGMTHDTRPVVKNGRCRKGKRGNHRRDSSRAPARALRAR